MIEGKFLVKELDVTKMMRLIREYDEHGRFLGLGKQRCWELGNTMYNVDFVNRVAELLLRSQRCKRCGAKLKQCFLTVQFGNGCSSLSWFASNGELLTVDHILPTSLGGENDILNYQLMCASCNSERGNRVSKLELREQLVEAKLRELKYKYRNTELPEMGWP